MLFPGELNIIPVSKTVLVVDDDYINYLLLNELLTNYGISVIHAVNGQIAVELCTDNREISMVLMDINMPVMDGITAARKIKEFRSDIPIISQSAYLIDAENYDDIFDDSMTKPINLVLFRKKLAQYLF